VEHKAFELQAVEKSSLNKGALLASCQEYKALHPDMTDPLSCWFHIMDGCRLSHFEGPVEKKNTTGLS
jgi:hypothetical protein